MNRFLFLLAMLCGIAHAQPTGADILPPAEKPQVLPPSCLPGLYGEQWPGAKIEPWVRGDFGWYAYGWCKGSDGGPVHRYLICTHGVDCPNWDFIGVAVRDLAAAVKTSSKELVYGNWWASSVQGNYCPAASEPRISACKELMAMIERDKPDYTPPAPPAPPASAPVYAYRVDAATSADGTRPAYAFVGGIRATASTGRATAGQPCVEALPSGTTGKVWGTFGPAFDPAKVALCVKAQ